jgi:hypothetical protein
MSNYTIPPLSRASDYAKGRLTQNEIISLQIANDANISKARKSLKMGVIPSITMSQEFSPEEMIADVASQEASARSNIERLGFRPQEASQIITQIGNDPQLDFSQLNSNFPSIETDIRQRFNVKLLTPSFFVEYFRKYSAELENVVGTRVFNPRSGVSNNMINNVAELREIIPDKDIVAFIARAAADSQVVGQDILSQLDRLSELLPSSQDLQALINTDPVRQQRIIDQLLTQFENLPSKDEIQALANMIQADKIGRADFQNQIREIVDAAPIGRQRNIIRDEIRDEIRVEGIPVAEETMEEAIARRDSGRRPPPMQRAVVAIVWLGDSVNSMADFNNLRIGEKKAFISQVGLSPYLKDADGVRKPSSSLTNANIVNTNVSTIVSAWLQIKNRIPANTKIVNSEVEDEFMTIVGNGLRRSIVPNIKIKVGRGLSVKQTPSYREYGKYAIHMPQLEHQDILNVKYKSLGQIPKFKPVPVSDIFRDFIVDLLENGKPNQRVYSQIPTDERKLFEEMSVGAGVWNGLGLKRTTTSTDEEENKTFELLKGEYLAGNNSPKVITSLRQLVVKMMNDGRIRRSQGVDLLMELS